MRKLSERIGGTKPLRRALPFALVWNIAVYFAARLLSRDLPHRVLEGRLDALVPVLPWTVCVYFLAFLFWTASFVLVLRKGEAEAWRFFGGEFLGKLICFFAFVLFPTTLSRPEVQGQGVFPFLLRFLYCVDAPTELFPSIHCFDSWYCCIAVRNNPTVPRWYRGLTPLLCAAVCLSTLTTHQHVLADVVSGVVLAELSYRIAAGSGFGRLYGRVFHRLTK